MTSEDEKKKKTKKKKPRKDKWGQLVPFASGEEHQPNNEPHFNSHSASEDEEYNEKDLPQQQEVEEIGYERNKVVVSGMPYSATEDEIRDLFKDIGTVSQLQLSRFPDSGNFRGLAFVKFPTEAIAKNSLNLDGTKMGNRFIKVEQCKLDPQRKRKSEFLDEPRKAEGCLSAYIGNLSWDVTEDDIRNCFSSCNVTSIRFALDKRTGTFRGFGHVDFADDKSLEEAMKMNQVELHGRPMKIAYAVSK